MKKVILIVIALVLLIGLYYFVNDNKDASELPEALNQQESSGEILGSEDFVWSATRLQEGPAGGSDFISTSELTLSVSGETYVINDYLEGSIYGCQQVTSSYRDGILEQYDVSYAPDFFIQFTSYYLCPSMGGGNLFVVDEVGEEYMIEHYVYGDGRAPFTETEPAILFSIPK